MACDNRVRQSHNTSMKLPNPKLLAYLLLIGAGAPPGGRATIYTESLFTTNTLFIEAEDAHRENGEAIAPNPVRNPPGYQSTQISSQENFRPNLSAIRVKA